MRKLFLALISAVLFSSVALIEFGCTTNKDGQTIVKKKDIEQYLTKNVFRSSTGLNRIESDISFWKEKLGGDPGSITYQMKLGSAYSRRFGVTKDIQDLHKADSLYQATLGQARGKQAENLQAMADLSITKHQFRDAYRFSKAALEIGDEKRFSMLLLFDAMMERGDYKLANENLDRLKNDFSFPYLVRLSKYKDYEGELDSAIHYMEEARTLVDHNSRLYAWSNSNLGDMYGHAGDIQKSYQAYLDVLGADNTGGAYLHSLQGIAWIAFARDGNTQLAKEILQFVDQHIHSPDVKPTLAEITEFEGNTKMKDKYLGAFFREAQKPAYYGMYNAALAELAATENIDKSLNVHELLNKELTNRPTPQIYDLLAWLHLHRGNEKQALELVQQHVQGKTREPVPAYHMAKVYLANGLEKKARKYFEESLAAGYELGPVTVNEIKEEMKNL